MIADVLCGVEGWDFLVKSVMVVTGVVESAGAKGQLCSVNGVETAPHRRCLEQSI